MPDDAAVTATPPTGGSRHVLVVCTGNICRSPTAAAVLAALAARHPRLRLEIRSRGTRDWNVGRPAHPAMARIAATRGYDLSGHVAAQVTADDLAWADDVLVMDDGHRRQLAAAHPPLARDVRLLDPAGIPDPWLDDDDAAYTASLDRIEAAVDAWLDRLAAG